MNTDQITDTTPGTTVDLVDAFFCRLRQETQFTAMVEAGALVANTTALVAQCHDMLGMPALPHPQIPDIERVALRLRCLRKELDDLDAALARRDLLGVARELTDLQYVLDGTYLECGLGDAKPHLFNAVHTAKMSLPGDDFEVCEDRLALEIGLVLGHYAPEVEG